MHRKTKYKREQKRRVVLYGYIFLCYTFFFVLNLNKSENALKHLPETDIQGAISVGILYGNGIMHLMGVSCTFSVLFS